MSDPFTIDRFLPHVGEVFEAAAERGDRRSILLTEITRLASEGSPRRSREPFSLVFHAPSGVFLEQGIYTLEREGMEPFECFLVAIVPDAHGTRYEAIFT